MSTDKLLEDDLLSYFLQAKSRESMQEALDFLLTPTELQELSNRIQILQMLKKGISQRQIAKELGVAIATVSRGARALKDNEKKS